MSTLVNTSQHKIPSRDGFILSATLLEPKSLKGCIQLNSATGVKKEFYLNFAKYLADEGYAVLLFDYRGIGESRPASLKGFKALNHEWGMKDMAATLDWLDNRFPSHKKYFIGHSAGGQQIGFMDNHHKINKAISVSSSTGYWAWLQSPYRYFTLWVWYVLAPIFTSTIGYLPSSWFKLGEDLPKGVANEWRSWCLSKNYFGKYLGKTISQHFFDQVKTPIHFLYPADDTIATDRTVESLKNFYSASPTTIEKIHPVDYGLKKIGHFGFFSRASKETLWPKTIKYFEHSPNIPRQVTRGAGTPEYVSYRD
jgi:predicted alpha/beta hydrolase